MVTKPASLNWRALQERLTHALARLNARERALVAAAAAVIGLALLWWVALAPALATLNTAPARHAALDKQLAHMQGMASTAQALRAQGNAQPPGRDQALRALEAATTALGGSGQITVLGDRATLTLRNTNPTALAQWLTQVRLNARALPVETRLNRDASGGWSGTVIVSGPGLAGS